MYSFGAPYDLSADDPTPPYTPPHPVSPPMYLSTSVYRANMTVSGQVTDGGASDDASPILPAYTFRDDEHRFRPHAEANRPTPSSHNHNGAGSRNAAPEQTTESDNGSAQDRAEPVRGPFKAIRKIFKRLGRLFRDNRA